VSSASYAGKTLRKEVETMRYQKPELIVLDSALIAVQGKSKDNTHAPDLVMGRPKFSIGAYEADE
jgi:hypothetical protein